MVNNTERCRVSGNLVKDMTSVTSELILKCSERLTVCHCACLNHLKGSWFRLKWQLTVNRDDHFCMFYFGLWETLTFMLKGRKLDWMLYQGSNTPLHLTAAGSVLSNNSPPHPNLASVSFLPIWFMKNTNWQSCFYIRHITSAPPPHTHTHTNTMNPSD